MELFWVVAVVVSLFSSTSALRLDGYLSKPQFEEVTGLTNLLKYQTYSSLLDFLENADQAYKMMLMEVTSAFALALPNEISYLRQPLIDAGNILIEGNVGYFKCLHELKFGRGQTQKLSSDELKLWTKVNNAGFEMFNAYQFIEKNDSPDDYPLLKFYDYPSFNPEDSFERFHREAVELLENMALTVKNMRAYVVKISDKLGVQCAHDDLLHIGRAIRAAAEKLYNFYVTDSESLNHYQVFNVKPFRDLRKFLVAIRKLTYLIHFS